MLVVGRIVRGCVRRNVRQRTERSESSLHSQIENLTPEQVDALNAQLTSYQLKPKSNFFQNWKSHAITFISTVAVVVVANVAVNWYYSTKTPPPSPPPRPP